MTAPVAVDVLPPSLRGKELADMTAAELQAVVYAQRAALAELIEASQAFAIAEAELRPSSKGYYDARERFLAALARCGGAQ